MILQMTSMKNFYKFDIGAIVLVQFPFTDLSAKKVRPALVICDEGGEDVLIVPISTTVNAMRNDVILADSDYKTMILPVISCVRYKKLFTLSKFLILKKVSELKQKTAQQIKKRIISFIDRARFGSELAKPDSSPCSRSRRALA